jgi:S-adenosylmethionine synthetase
MSYLFTSESVSEGHPDKVADQISDAILDEFLKNDPESKVACETFVSTGLVVVGGEVRSEAYVDIQQVTRRVINKIGYTKADYMFDGNSCGILSAIHEQSPDINRGVEKENPLEQGAGDQGMMFGYACKDTTEFMPLPLTLSHIALIELAKIRKDTNLMPYLRPDAKSQFTVEYNEDNTPERIHTIVISTQHDEFDEEDSMSVRIKSDIKNILIPRIMDRLSPATKKLFDTDYILHVNPTGKFVIGGPHGDTGLTGRKIIVDTYGGKGAHGGGAFSGKDSSKVDRSAAYAARHIAKNLVAAGVADEVMVQLAYAIGVAQPVSIFVNTFGTAFRSYPEKIMNDGQIAEKLKDIFDLRPASIIRRFGLKKPIFEATAAYGHMGRDPFTKEVEICRNGQLIKEEVQFFGWEKLDAIDIIKEAFSLSS